ncbi:MAG: Uncharacterised protein [Hyphomonas sp. TMED17]|nr:MAG: Uncharacterised protein [Hyphomonas sp. TMED17]
MRKIWLIPAAIGALLGLLVLTLPLTAPLMLTVLMTRLCQSAELTCDGTVNTFELHRIAITDLELDADRGPNHLTIDHIDFELGWSGLFQPYITSVKIDNPTILLALDHTLLGQQRDTEARSAALAWNSPGQVEPDIQIENGTLKLLTLAGPVKADFSLQRNAGADSSATFQIAPAELRLLDQHLNISAATAQLATRENRLEINLDLAIADLRLGEISADQLAVSITSDDSDIDTLAWRLNADEITAGDRITAEHIALRRSASRPVDKTGTSEILSAIIPFSVSGTIGAVATQELNAVSAKLNGMITPQANAETIALSFQLEASDVLISAVKTMHAAISFAGDLSQTDDTISGHGDLTLDTISAGSGAEDLRAVLAPYLADALSRLGHGSGIADIPMDGLSINAPYHFQRLSDTNWQVTFPDPVNIHFKPRIGRGERSLATGMAETISIIPDIKINPDGLVPLRDSHPQAAGAS